MDTLRQACALGLVTPREIDRGLVDVRSGVRSASGSSRCAITLRGRVVGTTLRAPMGSAARHAASVSILAEHDLGPRLVATVDQTLWLEPLPGRPLSEVVDTEDSLLGLTDACVALGTALAALHRLPVSRCPLPSVRRPVAVHRSRAVRETPLGEEVRHATGSDPELRRVVEAVGERWADRHWTLGRVDPADLAVDTRSGCRIRFGDAAAGGLGSADFDLAGCLAAIAWVAGGPESVAWLSGHFWNSYRRAGGPGQFHPQIQAMYALDAAWRAVEAGASGDTVHWWLQRAHAAAARSAVPVLAA